MRNSAWVSGSKEQPHILAIQEAFLENGFQTFNFDATNSFNESDGEKITLGCRVLAQKLLNTMRVKKHNERIAGEYLAKRDKK